MANTEGTSNIVALILGLELLDRLLETPKDERVDVGKTYDGLLKKGEKALKNARRGLYPNAPTKPEEKIPHSLPLDDYAGSYWNKGYRNISLALANTSSIYNPHSLIQLEQVLHADVLDKTVKHKLEIEHVNAEHFIAWMHPPNEGEGLLVYNAFKAEFGIGGDGKVAEMGLRYDGMMGENKIWFSKFE